MSQAYYWKTLDDGGLLIIALGIFGLVQVYLSYLGAFIYSIISSIVLILVPLGVVLVQGTATAILAELLSSRFFSYQVPRGTPSASPRRLYLRRFAILLLALLLVLGVWALGYFVLFTYSPFARIAYLVGYIIANVAAALIILIITILLD
ncbi:MAG: hypothetical protein ACFE9D_11785, partial [Promethearchaeota archaeon]